MQYGVWSMEAHLHIMYMLTYGPAWGLYRTLTHSIVRGEDHQVQLMHVSANVYNHSYLGSHPLAAIYLQLTNALQMDGSIGSWNGLMVTKCASLLDW